tara:strand:+ start:327 stop:782 length:456 start_codon:yes stop_codon:yes gene_type:complete
MATKSESRRIEQAFIFMQLYLLVKHGAIKGFDHKKEEIINCIKNIIDESDPKILYKINEKLDELNKKSGIKDSLRAGIGGHKFILLIYFLTLEIMGNSKTILPKELEPLFNDFLEVEYYNKSEEDRMSLRKSAIKQASKMFKRLQELGYYE